MNSNEKSLNEAFNGLNKRLEVIIALLLKGMQREGRTLNLKEQVEILWDLDLRPKSIADILSRTPKYISKELAGINKKNRKIRKEG